MKASMKNRLISRTSSAVLQRYLVRFLHQEGGIDLAEVARHYVVIFRVGYCPVQDGIPEGPQ